MRVYTLFKFIFSWALYIAFRMIMFATNIHRILLYIDSHLVGMYYYRERRDFPSLLHFYYFICVFVRIFVFLKKIIKRKKFECLILGIKLKQGNFDSCQIWQLLNLTAAKFDSCWIWWLLNWTVKQVNKLKEQCKGRYIWRERKN